MDRTPIVRPEKFTDLLMRLSTDGNLSNFTDAELEQFAGYSVFSDEALAAYEIGKEMGRRDRAK